MIRRGDFYYLFYSSGRFNDLTYAVGVARATSPLGPFTRYSLNPIISNNTKWGGAGHGGFTLDRDGTLWHLYHARYVDNPSYGRVQVLDRLLWTADNWPTFGNNKTPTITMQPGPRVFADSGAGRLTFAGTATDDVFVISRSASDASLLEVRRNDALLESMPYDQIETLTLSAAGGNDILILDASRGNVIPGAGANFTGGAGTDTVHLIGQSAQQALRLRAGVVTAGTGILTHSGAERLMLEDGSFHFDNAIANFEVHAGEGAQLHFHSAQQLASLTLSGYAAAALEAGGANGLVTTALSVAPAARLDLNDNDLIVDYDSVSPVGIWTGDAYDGVTGLIQSGRMISSGASGTLKALAIAEAREALGITGTQSATFAGRSVDSTAVLVKFTWGGDANLDGKINIDDYGRIDGNVSQSGSVWGYFNGDFNLDGKINIDDYGVIDGNIGQQDGVVL